MYGHNDWMAALFIFLFVFCLIFIYILASTTETDTTGKSYTRLTEGTFKQRYTLHVTQTFFSEQKLFKQHGTINESISGHSKTTTPIL